MSFSVRTPPSRRGLAGPPSERDVYSVSRLNREVRLLLESGMPVIWIEAELSNLSVPASGHWYFSLKDGSAQVRCAMWKTRNAGVAFRPRDGQQVLARARVGLYEPRGDFQLIVEHLEEAGLGALKRQFEQLKNKLAAEGLFAAERKRPLPEVPRRIGVVTSPSGAAIRDILHVLARRFAAIPVLIYPTAVQGAAAATEIVAAIETAGRRAECDVLIVARGGGSLEDLWCFNDERVARAIAACPIPVVSGVGHEVDVTIADFVADVRAPTPSAAAQLVVPDGRSWLASLEQTELQLARCMRRALRTDTERLLNLRRRLSVSHPGARLAQHVQRLDDLEQRLVAAQRSAWLQARDRYSRIAARFAANNPTHRLSALEARRAALELGLVHAMRIRVTNLAQRLTLAGRALDTVSPLATLQRGFAIVTRATDGRLVASADSVAVGEAIDARLAHGRITATVTATHKNAAHET
ncbi:MAG: exodeoxyribonuclease VII large subunit [Steroidobacteraceae bacterium]